MSAATIFGLCGALLAGLGMYGVIVQPHPLRKLVSFNVLGGGVFLVFGVAARRGAADGLAADPIPQAMVITAIVVAFVSTALAVALLLRLYAELGGASLRAEPGPEPDANGNGS